MNFILGMYKLDWNGEKLEMLAPTSERIAKQVAREMAADADGKIRQALIDLGWTPPADTEERR